MNQYDPIHDTLKDFKVSVDKDKLWANTAHAIPKKRKRRGVFFLLSGSLLMGAFLLYQLGIGDAEPSFQTSNENIRITDMASAESELNQKVSIDENLPSRTQESKQLKQSTIHDYRAENNMPVKSQTNNRATSRVKNQHDLSKGRNVEHASIPVNPVTGQLDEYGSIGDNSLAITLPSIDMMYDQYKTIAGSDLISIVEPSVDDIARDLAISSTIESLLLSPLDINSSQITPISSALTEPNLKKNKIRLLFLQGSGWSTLALSTSDEAVKGQAEYWQENMRSLENISTSLTAALHLSKSIRIMGGLQYSRLTTEIVTQEIYTEQYQTEGITAIVIDSDGERQNLIGQIEGYRETHIQSTRYTTQQRLNAELLLNLAFQRSARFESAVWIKGAYNLLYEANGTTFNQENSLVSFGNNNKPFTLSSPFTFGAGLSSMYRLHPRWTIDARIGYERYSYTHGWLDDKLTFTHNLLNLSFGTSYTF